MRFWTIVACGMLFVPPPVLALLGWDVFAQQGPAWVKFHPATYLFLAAAIPPIAARHPGALRLLTLPRFRCYALAAVALSLWAIVLTGGQSGGGEMSSAVVTFVTPALMLVALTTLTGGDAQMVRRLVHALLIANSLIALAEYAIGTHLLPVSDGYALEGRSYGLFGHPLASAGMCGLMLVRLVLAGDDGRPPHVRAGEALLHALALLTFGGRAALLCVPVAVVATILVRRGRGGRAIGFVQRLGAFAALVLGGVLLALPIGAAQAILGRFGEDAGSAGTRLAALSILGSLGWKALLFGASAGARAALRIAFDTETAVEIAWINLVLSYGVIATAMISAALLTLFFRMTRDMDVSGWGMTVYFFLVQSSAIGFGSKSVVIAQALLVILAFCRVPARGAPRAVVAGGPQRVTPDPAR